MQASLYINVDLCTNIQMYRGFHNIFKVDFLLINTCFHSEVKHTFMYLCIHLLLSRGFLDSLRY